MKELLYAYRVLLTGIFVLEIGEIEANLLTLNARYKQPGVDDLIVRKTTGAEHGILSPDDLAAH